jgi:hypothetical protein
MREIGQRCIADAGALPVAAPQQVGLVELALV